MSGKLNISLVGGQPSPVYLFIKYDAPDCLMLICSEQTAQQARTIKNACKAELGLKEIIIKVIDANDVGNVKTFLNGIDGFSSSYDEISVNVSGGTKTWSILFFQYFSQKDYAKCFFIDQNNTVWDFRNDRTVKIQQGLAINEVLMLNNYKARHVELSVFSKDDTDVLPKIRKIRSHNPRAFTEIILKYAKDRNPTQSKTVFDSKNMCNIQWDLHNRQFFCEFYNKRKGLLQETVKSPRIWSLLVHSGWFELEVALMLSRWNHISEMWLNSEMIGDTDPGILNEFDIIINTGTKLLFVECKTQIKNITDIDKFNNGIKEYGGTGCKGLFVTDAEMRPEAKAKCDKYNIPHFSLGDIRDNKDREKLFFLFLEEHMSTVNEK